MAIKDEPVQSIRNMIPVFARVPALYRSGITWKLCFALKHGRFCCCWKQTWLQLCMLFWQKLFPGCFGDPCSVNCHYIYKYVVDVGSCGQVFDILW